MDLLNNLQNIFVLNAIEIAACKLDYDFIRALSQNAVFTLVQDRTRFFLPLMRTLPRDGVGTHRDRVGPHICINFQLGGRLGPTETRPQGRAGHQGAPPNFFMIRKKNFFLSPAPLDFWTFRRSFWAVARWQKDFPWRCPI